jgi:predicted RNase H-like nuclease
MQRTDIQSDGYQQFPSAITFIGFDSAWTDNSRAPGAICAVIQEKGGFTNFEPPRLVSFSQALDFIGKVVSRFSQ